MKILTKFTYILLLLSLVLGCLPLTASAEDGAPVASTDSFEYTLSSEGFATITAYSGNTNSVTIPEKLGGHPVVAIAEGVFSGHTEIVNLIFSDGLQSIGARAFYGCHSIQTIILPHSLLTIGESAFEACSSAYHIDIGSSLISLGEKAFFGCPSVDSVSLPEAVSSVGKLAFAECSNLREVFVAATYATVAPDAFKGSPLVTVYAPAGASVHTAGGDYPRVVAAGAEVLVFEDFVGGLAVTDIVGQPQAIIIPSRTDRAIVAIDSYALAQLPTLQAVHLPDTVIKIDKAAFKDDTALTFVRLPRRVKSSPERELFYGCTALRRVYIPEGTETIGMEAFLGCSSLAAVTFPSTLIRIKSGAFFGCSALSSLRFLGAPPECAMMNGSKSSVVMGSAPQDMQIYAPVDMGWGAKWRPNGSSPYLSYTVNIYSFDCFYVENIIVPLSCAEDGVAVLVCHHCGDSFRRVYPKYPHSFVSVGMGNGVESFRCTGCTENYTVGRLEIVDITATVDNIYTDTEMIRSVTVTYRGVPLTEGVDYTMELEYSVQKSRITITVTGMGEYAGSRRAAYSSLTGNKLTSYTLTVVGGTGSGEYFRDDVVEIYPNEPIPEGMEAVWTVEGAKLRQGNNEKAVITMPANDVTVTLGYRQATVTTPPVTPPRPDDTTTPPPENVTTPPEETDPPVTTPDDTDPPFGDTDPAHKLMGRAILFGAILVVSLAGFVVMCIFMFKKDIKKN